MTASNYTYLLAHPQKIDKEQLAQLESVIGAYPYFQSARALQLKGLKNDHSFLYNDALKVTAAYTTDRDILFEYITSEKFIQNEISEVILQHDQSVNEIEVVSEDVSKTLSLEIDKQLKTELQKAEAILNPALFERKDQFVSQLVEEEVEEIDVEHDVQINEPLPFTEKDTHSFSEWLKLTKAKPIDRTSEEDKKKPGSSQEDKDRKFDLIEKFIQQRPKMKPKVLSDRNTNLAEPFTQASETLMTETLAKVYLQQKNYDKAIQAYKILILKNPEKSGFFADQIRAIKKLKKTET